jgi:hypothetical protein
MTAFFVSHNLNLAGLITVFCGSWTKFNVAMADGGAQKQAAEKQSWIELSQAATSYDPGYS